MKFFSQLGLFIDVIAALLISFDMLKPEIQKSIRNWLVSNSSFKLGRNLWPSSEEDFEKLKSIAFLAFLSVLVFSFFIDVFTNIFENKIFDYLFYPLHIFMGLIFLIAIFMYLPFKFSEHCIKILFILLQPLLYVSYALLIVLGFLAKAVILPFKVIESYFAEDQLPRVIGATLLVLGFSLQLLAVTYG